MPLYIGSRRPLAYGGNDIPTWALGSSWKNFAANTGNMPDVIELVSGTRYVRNAAGVLIPFTGTQITRTDLGLHTMPGRTNLALQSQDLTNAYWAAVNTTCVASAIAGSVPSSTLQKVTSQNLSGARVQNSGTSPVVISSVYAATFDMAPDTSNFGGIVTVNATAGAIFDLTGNGSVVSTVGAGAVSASIIKLGGIYRCTLVFTSNTTSEAIGVGPSNGTTYVFTKYPSGGAGTSIYAGNAQLELGSFAIPPIPTLGTAVTVAANQQSTLLSGLDAGFSGLIQIVNLQPGVASGFGHVFSMSVGNGGSVLALSLYRNTTGQFFADSTAGDFSANVPPIQAAGQRLTFAFAFGPNYAKVREVNAVDPAADTSVTMITGIDRINFGASRNPGVQGYQFTTKLALKRGAQNDTTFNAMFAQAQLASIAA